MAGLDWSAVKVGLCCVKYQPLSQHPLLIMTIITIEAAIATDIDASHRMDGLQFAEEGHRGRPQMASTRSDQDLREPDACNTFVTCFSGRMVNQKTMMNASNQLSG